MMKDVFRGEKLYCILGEEFSLGRDNTFMTEQMLEAGVKIIQYREKAKAKIKKYEECLKIRSLTKDAGALLIVNDDVDIAILCEADGVHIGQDDLPAIKVRKLISHNMILGVSTHSPEQAQKALVDGADYIGAGPIFRTYTKKDVCEPVGLDYLKYVAKNISIPHVAIGGIKVTNLNSVLESGATCVCLVTEILGSHDVVSQINRIRTILDDGVKK